MYNFYPVINLGSNYKILVNFGKDPFKFNLIKYNLKLLKNKNEIPVKIFDRKVYYQKIPTNILNIVNNLSKNSRFDNNILEKIISNQVSLHYTDLIFEEEGQITDE